jgi:hypothetical protein
MSDQPTELLPEHPDHPDHHRHAAEPANSNRTRNLVIALAAALFLILIVIIVWLLFFRGAPGPGPTPTPTPTGSSSSATPTPTPTETVSPPPLEPQTCTTDNSTVEFGEPDGAAGSTFIPLIFTNTGSEPCTLEGFPTVEFVGDGDGTQVGAAATEDAATSPVELITVDPGTSAQATLKITTAGNVCEPVAVDGFRVIPPGSSDAFFIEETAYDACAGDVSIMTVSAVSHDS